MEHDLDVRAIRTTLGLTQSQLGEAVGVDQSTVSNWENGSQPSGSAKKLLLLLISEGVMRPSPSAPSEAA